MIAGIEKYNITAENIYNWDEKGFVIGQATATQRIMSREALESGRITRASQDGSREFISLLACISAIGAVLPPALIYKGDSSLHDTWLEDWIPGDIAHFAVSSNGWSSNALGLHWLKTIFQRYTSEIAKRGRRLLIVDGHSSHVNLQFIELCDQLRILLLILPPHSTHRLQPLDVSLFAPLARFYTNNLNNLIANSLGMISMSKRSFWGVFWPAWKEAFLPINITSGFTKTGIWPFNPVLVLSKIVQPPSQEAPPSHQGLRTPMTSHAVRRIQQQYRKAPSSPLIAKVFRANERLVSQHSIDQHTLKGLVNALKDEKKKRRRGKRLNLVGDEDVGPQFFSPARVEAARTWQALKDAEEVQRQQGIQDKKATAAMKKAQKEEEKVQKQQIAIERRIQKAANQQVQNALKESLNKRNGKQAAIRKQSTKLPKAQNKRNKQPIRPHEVIATDGGEGVVLATSSGRRVQCPRRFAH